MDPPPEPSGPAPPSPAGPLPGPPAPPAAGCLKALGIGCGSFIVLVLAAVALAYLNFGTVATWLEKRFVRGAIEDIKADGALRAEVEQVLREYDAAWREKDLGASEWKAALNAFSRSPAALVLSILKARAAVEAARDLPPEEKQRAVKTFDRLARGAAEEKVTADGLAALVERSLVVPPPKGDEPRAVDVAGIGSEELKRFLPEAEKLLDERGVPEGPFTPDIPALLRRDLRASLGN